MFLQLCVLAKRRVKKQGYKPSKKKYVLVLQSRKETKVMKCQYLFQGKSQI